MARSAYCNNTTDLTSIYANLAELQEKRTIEDWSVYSGSVYLSYGQGYVDYVYQSSKELTASVSLVAISAGKYFYDSATDTLYVQTTNSSAPDNFDMQSGTNWSAYTTQLTKNASEEIDGYLGALFPVPIPKSIDRLSGYSYDYNLVRATALLTIYYLVYRVDSDLANQSKKDCHEILDNYLKGKLKFSWDNSSAKVGQAVIFPRTTNTASTVIPRVTGFFTGVTGNWVAKITTAGAIGTAYYQVSYDNGVTYNSATSLTSVEWQGITDGVYIKWETSLESAGSLTLNDLYYIKVTANNEQVNSTTISNIRLRT